MTSVLSTRGFLTFSGATKMELTSWRHSEVFIVSSGQLLLCSSVSIIVNFEQVNIGWDWTHQNDINWRQNDITDVILVHLVTHSEHQSTYESSVFIFLLCMVLEKNDNMSHQIWWYANKKDSSKKFKKTSFSFPEKKLNHRYFFTHFMPLVSFYTPWKHQKTFGFLMFSGV